MSLQGNDPGVRVGVGVSGGADSVYLLYSLRESGRSVSVLHVNHKLRGAESDADEAFVRELAAQLDLPFHVALRPIEEGNVEQEARLARYAFFAECVAGGICDVVATGHTLDDQAETVLSRFLRGSGTAGLSGIRPSTSEHVVRPMLGLRRQHIRHELRERGIVWREDRSNLDTELLRNRLRLEILPLLGGLNPQLPEVLGSTATWAQGEEEYWSAEITRLEQEYFQVTAETVLIAVSRLHELQVAVQRRLLRRAVEMVRGSLRAIDFNHIEAIRRLTDTREGSGRLQLPDLDIYRSFDWLRFAPVGIDSRLGRDFEVELSVPGRTDVRERLLTIEMELVTRADVYNKQMNGLDWSSCAGSHAGALKLRNWRPGDRYQPVGKSGSEKIKTLFQEYRVPLWERRTWPVVTRTDAAGSESIVWTRRFGPSVECAVRPDSEQILTIREAGESNCGLLTSNVVDERSRDDHVRVGVESVG